MSGLARGIVLDLRQLSSETELTIRTPTTSEIARFGRQSKVAFTPASDAKPRLFPGMTFYDEHGRAVALVENFDCRREQVDIASYGFSGTAFVASPWRINIRCRGIAPEYTFG